MPTQYTSDFQTPWPVAKYMVSLLPRGVVSILEPTPGTGTIVRALSGYQVTAPKNFFDLDPHRTFDAVVMNPPFSAKYTFGAPKEFTSDGMKVGYWFLWQCLQRSGSVIALMPWFTISDSDVRLRRLKKFGLISVTALPRKTFEFARIQTVVLQLEKTYTGPTEFKVFDLLTDNQLCIL